MRKPAKKTKVNNSVLGAVGAAIMGVLAGAAAMFLSEKENREQVERTVKTVVKRGKVEVAKAKRKVSSSKKKVVRK